ncbi:MAG: hypothetical protein AAF297_03925 [Planctomycetota bacterium]
MPDATGPIRRLESREMSVEIWPHRGARIASLFDIARNKEWMDRPPASRGLQTNQVGDDFGKSPLVGADECFPTVGAAEIDGKTIPDHGEVWPRTWQEIETGTPDSCTLRCELDSLPLTIERTATVSNATLRLDYRVTNRADAPTPHLWCWHPLFVMPKKPDLVLEGIGSRFRVESSIGLTPEQESLLIEHGQNSTLNRLDLGTSQPSAAKLFCSTNSHGRAILQDRSQNAALTVAWQGKAISGLGLWINRGGWAGYSHVAIEPTTTPVESIADVPDDRWLAARAVEEWALEISVSRPHTAI